MTLDSDTRQQIEDLLVAEISILLRHGADERERQQRRITQLKSERRTLLQACYADAISLEQLKEEYARIRHELSSAKS